MLNFLIQSNKKKIIIEYMLRMLSFFFLFLGIACLLLITLFLPSVFFSGYKNQTIHHQLESLTTTAANKNEDPIQMIKNVNMMVQIFSRGYNSTGISTSDIMKKTISLKNNTIHIANISVSENTDLSKTIIVKGFADTRDGLTTFNNDLRSEGVFSSVNLPIASLIKETNTDFTITLVYKK